MIKLPENIARSYLSSLCVIILSVLTVYFPILDGPFKVVYDSDHIVENAILRHPASIPQILTRNLFNPEVQYRPLTVLSHMLVEHSFGRNPYYYYLLNVFFHAGCAVLVFLIMATVTRNRIWALVTALLFGLHPAHWEAVSFLSGRAVLLNTFFNLAAMAAFLRYMRRLNGWWLCLSLVSFVGALLSHEAYLSMIVIILFYGVFMVKDDHPRSVKWLVFLPYAVMALMFVLIRHAASGFHIYFSGNMTELVRQCVDVFKMIFIEMGILLVPFKVHFHQTTQAWPGFDDPRITSVLAVLMMFFIGLAFLRKKLDALIAFLLVWFLAGLWPLFKKVIGAGAANVSVAVDGTVSYMAAVPLIAVVLFLGWNILSVLPKGRWWAGSILAVVITVFGFTTFQHNILSTDEVAVLKESLDYSPGSAVLAYHLGTVYAQNQSPELAQKSFERAVVIDPNFTSAAMGLAKALYEQGQWIEAAKAYEAIQNPGRYRDVLSRNLSLIYRALAEHNEKIVRSDPKNINSYFSLGVYYERMGSIPNSIAAYQQVIELDPADHSGLTAIALKFQGLIYHRLGQTAKAQENFDRANALSL